MRKIIILLALVVLVSGCATAGRYERLLKTWVGSNVSDLIESWGPPADTFKMPNGSMMYTWLYDGGAVAMPIGNMAYAVNRSCKTTFTVDEHNIIQRWRWEGNACRR